MVKEAVPAEECKAKAKEIEEIFEDLRVIQGDKSSMLIVKAVTNAMAARCLMEKPEA